ncbi:hydantoinase [Candidatus Formimonas warabiya]|uniref:Hydantoinase n=1 Tax=Formimonas warabiya TaxID=1761012 RepID=A0A3G1L1W5_FORW1|nr:hydantoinase [Candidatus Formimonas warabiya]
MDVIATEMGVALERSSRSPIFAEACDFACGICSGEGDLVSQLNGIPILAAAGSFSVRAVLEKYRGNIGEGDVFIINDPYWGGNHLPDIGIITPVFYENELMFFAVSRAHHGDIGGSTAGSYNPKATEIFQEGVRIPPLKLFSQGKLISEVMDLITYNTRNPDMIKSDLLAQMGANQIGKQRITALCAKYTNRTIQAVIKELLDRGEYLVRREVAKIPDGTYTGIEYLDDDGFQEDPIKIQVAVIVKGETITVDFTGTDAQVKGFVNSSLVTSSTAAYIAVLWGLSPEIPRNSGAFRAIQIVAPKGTVVNPHAPAPMTLCTLHPAGEIISAVFKALAQIMPDRIPAGFGRYCGPSFYGIDPRNDQFYVGFAFCCLGSGGALAGMDGRPYMSPISNYGGVRTPNIEVNEVQYPHTTLCHEMEPDTAGAGKFRGGPGIRYQIRFSSPAEIVMFGDGKKIPPYGLAGGHTGSANRPILEYQDGRQVFLGTKELPRKVQAGDSLTLISSGGGGWGSPKERDRDKVREDYRNGLISEKTAKDVYGVDLDE